MFEESLAIEASVVMMAMKGPTMSMTLTSVRIWGTKASATRSITRKAAQPTAVFAPPMATNTANMSFAVAGADPGKAFRSKLFGEEGRRQSALEGGLAQRD